MIRKNVGFILFALSFPFLSCVSKQEVPGNIETEQLLEKGEWRLQSFQEQIKHFQTGIKFSPDKQVFYLDSQGHVIPPHFKQIYSVSNDTLMIIDYKYEERFRLQKGTDILLIKEITDKELHLETIYPKKGNQLIYKKP